MAIPPHVVSGQPIASVWGNQVVDELQRQADQDNWLNQKIDANWGAQNNWNQATQASINDHENRIARTRMNNVSMNGRLFIQGGGATQTTDGNGAIQVPFPEWFAGPPLAAAFTIVVTHPVIATPFDFHPEYMQIQFRWNNANADVYSNQGITYEWIAFGSR